MYTLQEEGRDLGPLATKQGHELVELVSPWANITYGGCRYLREARLEALHNYSVLHEYFKELNHHSIFDRVLDPQDEEYVLMGLIGHYHDVEGVLKRLGSEPIKPPLFFLERIEKAKEDLDAELKLLEIARREVHLLYWPVAPDWPVSAGTSTRSESPA